MQKNKAWLNRLKVEQSNWETTYVIKALNNTDKRDELFELLTNLLNLQGDSFYSFFIKLGRSDTTELFLIKLKNAWLAKERRSSYLKTATLSCIVKV
jgi:hypothetical protein